MHSVLTRLILVVLQVDFPVEPRNVEVTTGLGGGAVGAFFTTLVVGAILVALAPDWTRGMMDRVVDDALGSFVYGLVCLLFLVLVAFVLVITLIGIPVAILLALLAGLVWAVGAAIGYLAIADRLLDREDWLVPLLAAAAMNGVLTLTGIGGLVSFCIGAAGFGTVLRDWLE